MLVVVLRINMDIDGHRHTNRKQTGRHKRQTDQTDTQRQTQTLADRQTD